VVAPAAASAVTVQREAEPMAEATAGPAPVSSPPPPVAPAPGAGQPPGPVATAGPGAAPEELLATLFDPLLRRLKAELRIDRDRRGSLTDLRR
jgi:hypothetical protein